MTASLAATRTSHRWTSHTGNFDAARMRAIFPGDGRFGMPLLPRCDVVPDRLVAYSDRHRCDAEAGKNGVALHFFIDDYRFEPLWSQPVRSLPRVQRIGLACTPDFSVWTGLPLALAAWQVYRSRWCGAWMAMHGVTVIPTVTWAEESTFEWAFDGIPRGSVVAVSAVGVRGDALPLFRAGLAAMLARVDPPAVLSYGRLPYAIGDCQVIEYPTRWKEIKGGRQG